ncbi:PREDICTED: xylosyltransferase oxt-like [Rhagoletis zephyria]|uniref:xylosyltransferase oxt-like n=1 Tax=Rhagoletis zephyria TaxID=28612 RepID=UPI0008115D26|nr:PREDICTED: xylosyltransferase oxt-like [Rhagoletis zephyria]
MADNIAIRWLRRYKLFFLLGLLIFGVQIFLAYKSLNISSSNVITANANLFLETKAPTSQSKKQYVANGGAIHHFARDDHDANTLLRHKEIIKNDPNIDANFRFSEMDSRGGEVECNITAKEAISAMQRAKTNDCRKQIARIACAIQAGDFYPQKLPTHCPAGNYTPNAPLGCFQDEKDYRLLSGYFTNLKSSNSPQKCIRLCLQSGFPYAGVQYATECFCGADVPPLTSKLPDSRCNMKCSGNPRYSCGGYFTINVYETGIAKFTSHMAEARFTKPDTERVRIVFLLTLNGRALRQVHRLIKTLYSPEHFFYIHVDVVSKISHTF